MGYRLRARRWEGEVRGAAAPARRSARTDVIECLPFGLDGPIAPRSFRRVEAIPVQAACARRQSFDQVRDPGRVLAPVFESNHAAADLLARMGYAEPVEVHGDDLPLAVPGHGLEIETAVGFRALLERRGKRRAGLRLRLRQRPRSLWLDGLDAGDGLALRGGMVEPVHEPGDDVFDGLDVLALEMKEHAPVLAAALDVEGHAGPFQRPRHGGGVGAGDLLHRHRLAHPLQTAHADTAGVAQMAQ